MKLHALAIYSRGESVFTFRPVAAPIWSRLLSENVKRYLAAGTSFTARLRESPSAFVPRYFEIDFRCGLHGLFRREL